ncbi:MAG: ABC transporter permease [Pirellula sp.]|nr:ABC transporter permease [Pirellula sp.]
MYKLWIIAYREYVAMVGTKAFLFSMVMMPVLMFGSLFLMPLLQKIGGGRELKILVADGSGRMVPVLQEATAAREKQSQRGDQPGDAALESPFGSAADRWVFSATDVPILTPEARFAYCEQIRKGELYGLLEIPDSLLSQPQLTKGDAGDAVGSAKVAAPTPQPVFYANDAMMSEARLWCSQLLSKVVRAQRIQQFNLDTIDPEILNLLEARVDIAGSKPIDPSSDGRPQSPIDAIKSMFLPFGVMMLMFMVILMAAQPMLESAMEEKSLRISEVLIGAVTPTQLMGGKLLGNVAGSRVIFILYGAGGIFVLNQQSMLSLVPLHLIPWFLLFQVLGVLFFSSIFLVVGASVNELKEAQALLLPVWMVLMAPVMVWFIAVRDPNGGVATALSFFPPSCPLTMVLRLATGVAIPVWQPIAAAVLMIASTMGMVVLAGRIYRVGLLRTDGVRSIAQLLRRAIQAN